MLVKTKNSLYQVWMDENKIRKLDNSVTTTHSVGREWSIYDYMPHPPVVGGRLRVMFVSEDGDHVSQFATSKIVEIIEQKNFIYID